MCPRSETVLTVDRFALPTGSALETVRQALNAHGYVHLRQVVPSTLVERLTSELEAAAAVPSPRAAADFLRDARGKVVCGFGVDKYNDFIYDLARRPEVLAFASGLVSSGVIPLKAEYFAKPGPGAAAVPPHQDQAFHNSHFDDEMALALWCPLTPIGLGDSPLEFGRPAVAPWRLLPHLPHDSPGCDLRLSVAAYPEHFIPVPVRPGDLIVYHAYAVHRTAAKAGSAPWKAFVMNFRSSPYRALPDRQ